MKPCAKKYVSYLIRGTQIQSSMIADDDDARLKASLFRSMRKQHLKTLQRETDKNYYRNWLPLLIYIVR